MNGKNEWKVATWPSAAPSRAHAAPRSWVSLGTSGLSFSVLSLASVRVCASSITRTWDFLAIYI